LRLCGAHCMITNFQWYVKKHKSVGFEHTNFKLGD
jgi:hypothetical protein